MLNLTQYLDPLFVRIDDILKVPSDKGKSTQYPEEVEYLRETQAKLTEEIKLKVGRLKELESQLEDLIRQVENSTGDDKSSAQSEYNKYHRLAKLQIDYINNRLLTQFDSPYFGKVVFHRKADSNFPPGGITSYIGKKAYFDEDSQRVVITDWRAPIANLYYNNSGPEKNVSFTSPVGVQSGDLVQKRQLDISNGILSNIYEQTTGNANIDAFLLANLERRMGKKLQDIIATIQEEQNSIIREAIGRTVIVQGVAGSGKTTILLHKISYIAYNHKDDIKISNSLVIAPNVLFLDYISDALNTLGVFGINRNTYQLWARSKIGWDEKFTMSNEQDNIFVKRFKGSTEFIKIVKDYLLIWEQELIKNMPYQERKMIKMGESEHALPGLHIQETVRERFNYLKKQFPLLSLEEKLNLALDYAIKQQNYGKNYVSSYFNETYEPYKIEGIRKYFKRECKSYNVYRKLFTHGYLERIMAKRGISVNKKKLAQIRSYTTKTLTRKSSSNQYKAEDVPAILFIENYIKATEQDKYDYILIDEAQDISLFAIFTLFLSCKNSNITITGDTAQSIIPPFYIKDWQEVRDMLTDQELISDLGFNKPTISYHNLVKCYRTTVEVIDYTRDFLYKVFGKESLPFNAPEGVVRHGDPVEEIETEDMKKSLQKIVNDRDEKGDSTTAILCRDYKHADEIFQLATEIDSERPIYNYEVTDYQSGILILPIEKAKGLEFDSVIVADMSSRYLLSDRKDDILLDTKLLYVAFTRSLHKLYVLSRK